jgi:diacylglycerol kinase family enzyme
LTALAAAQGGILERVTGSPVIPGRPRTPRPVAGRTFGPVPPVAGPVALVSHTGTRSGRRLGRAGLEDLAQSALGPAAGPVQHVSPDELAGTLGFIGASAPRAVAVLGGDGTARTALEVLTPMGIPVLPLPGGTLNRLSRNLFGRTSARQLLGRVGELVPRPLPGGRVGAHRFFVASGYGPLMRLSGLREAVRSGGLSSLPALARRFAAINGTLWTGQLELDGSGRGFDMAVIGVGPVDRAFGLGGLWADQVRSDVSLEPGLEPGLEIALGRWRHWGAALGLAPAVLAGGWRRSGSIVALKRERLILADLQGDRIDALLDGEPLQLDGPVEVVFEADCGLVLGPGR